VIYIAFLFSHSEEAVKAAETYFEETKESATEVCKQTVISLDKVSIDKDVTRSR
jgi:hypothetical protein